MALEISWHTATNAIAFGGYLEMATGRYIVPEWFSDLSPDNYSGLSHEDYEKVERDTEHYLRTPVLRLTAKVAFGAIASGIDRAKVVRAGMTKSEYWDLFYPNVQGTFPHCSDEEYAVYKAVHACIDQDAKAWRRYIHFDRQFLTQVATEWFGRYGIKVGPEPTAESILNEPSN